MSGAFTKGAGHRAPGPALCAAAVHKEAARQAAVLAACRTPLPFRALLDETQACTPLLRAAGLKTDAAGLRAYQGHARALACRVMGGAYPTLAAMLGEEALNTLAWRLWQGHPPCGGDLGDWGEGLAALVEDEAALHAWPWLADSARLDWCRHLSSRAADAELDADSLALLGHEAPEALTLALHPSVHLLASAWPVAALWAAHRLPEAARAPAAALALSDGEPGFTVVWRTPGWDIQVRHLPRDWGHWMAMLAAPSTAWRAPHLAALLDQCGPDFDLADWLATALREGWLWRVRPVVG